MSQFCASDALSSVDFISARDVLAYHSAGIESVEDLLDRLPRRYEDRRRFDNFPTQAGSGLAVENNFMKPLLSNLQKQRSRPVKSLAGGLTCHG